MSSPINMLRLSLGPFSTGLRAPDALSDSSDITRVRRQILREHGSAKVAANDRSIMSAISSFRESGNVASFRDLKYVCLGMSGFDERGWCVLSDSRLHSRVTQLIEGQSEMRRRIRCFQALLSSYWTFPKNAKENSADATAGWVALRDWLRVERERIVASKEPTPPWFATLSRRIALLGNDPCREFGDGLLRGEFSELLETMERLAIPRDSWVAEEAVMAQVEAGCALDDGQFKTCLEKLLTIGTGRGDLDLGESLRMRIVALLVRRYAKCRDREEHIALRDAAVSTIGNPWLRRVSWDAWVVDEKGKPDDDSRNMVNSWLKRRLITDFFELLSVDGTGDSRRVDYWLRFEPVIADMWFALGAEAHARRGEQFSDFKKRAKGRLLYLEGTSADNNAFVMRIGDYLFVEFGAKGNAMYLFEWAKLRGPVLDALGSGQPTGVVNIALLKAANHRSRLIHRDSAAETWEQKFDGALTPLIGAVPSHPLRHARRLPHTAGNVLSPPAWSIFVQAHGLRVQDDRHLQGSLWVLGVEQPSSVLAQLKAWGFKERAPRGWYKYR
jgi:hypothetical protein